MIKPEFEFKVGDIIKDEKRNIVVKEQLINPKPRITKGYLCECLDCHYQFISSYNKLVTRKQGCACCTNQVVVYGINSIADTNPWMIDYFVDKEDAKRYTHSSGLKVKVKCPNCGFEKEKRIVDIYRRHSIGCHCQDHTSFAEKFIHELLEQSGFEFIWQATKTNLHWIENLNKYDFYIPSLKCIIEVHGEQHYKQQGRFRRTLAEEQENDRQKEELALANGIKNYIIVNCEDVYGNKILENIKNSELLNILNLNYNDVNWAKCFEKGTHNIDKEICDYFKQHPSQSTIEIGKIFGFNKSRIREILVRGTEIGWCNYDPVEARRMRNEKIVAIQFKTKSNPFEVFKDGVSVGLFYNTALLENYSRENLPYLLSRSRIADAYNGHIESYKGFTFKKITQEEYNNREENKECLNLNLV